MMNKIKVQFQSTPPVKAATGTSQSRQDVRLFQSTPPVKAATFAKFQKLLPKIFQSTPPVKAATRPLLRSPSRPPYFNPRRP